MTNNMFQRDDEVDVNQINLCIVPGLEGNCERFRGLCEEIKMPALVLQPGLDYPYETIPELAERYAKVWLVILVNLLNKCLLFEIKRIVV